MVANIGDEYSGREVVQLYVEAVDSRLGRPARELIGFARQNNWTVENEAELRSVFP